jgi:hypothetical protein
MVRHPRIFRRAVAIAGRGHAPDFSALGLPRRASKLRRGNCASDEVEPRLFQICSTGHEFQISGAGLMERISCLIPKALLPNHDCLI